VIRDVRDALRYDPAADTYQVNVDASQGTVRLTGAVESWHERRLAERLARGVSGVKAVQNGLTINVFKRRLDAEVKGDIESRLRWDTLVNDGLLEVDVRDGSVRLSGAVGSASEKTEAYIAAWVHGERSVDASKLDVEWWARDSALRKGKYVEITDAQIASAVREALTYDPRVSAYDLDVAAKGGRVTLSGKVKTRKARLAAESIARHTVGVVAVQNQLAIAPGRLLTDGELAARLTSALQSNSVLDTSEIRVEVSDGNVTLSGRVPTRFESAEAVDVAGTLEGVRAVDNRLAVTSPELSFVWRPRIFPYGPYVEGWRYVAEKPAQSDAALSRSIQREFEWSPVVDADQIHIQVRDGKAVLTGTVADAQARRAAEESALEAGAIAVENHLTTG
jgi:osmotically-inducible protein OsmY